VNGRRILLFVPIGRSIMSTIWDEASELAIHRAKQDTQALGQAA